MVWIDDIRSHNVAGAPAHPPRFALREELANQRYVVIHTTTTSFPSQVKMGLTVMDFAH